MTMLHMAVLVLSLVGFMALAMAMPKHNRHLLRSELSVFQKRSLRLLGWSLLVLALGLCLRQWGVGIGMVTWLGWLTIAGMVLAFCLPNGPDRKRVSRRKIRDHG
ncbi:DUF3325 domain-containing protein [Marinobacter oulmenensis]|uniref:DUF3325 domain-containing protein n=1 Tax=Marinobacter oulmenensis TaxID=643747 RepID=A0A840UBY9_9GAMM|nr:DUF3325 domain-containing protein [Marinobacter oulmenensis]MBB5320770.1 hypothetical protein [Marinobacter oulmenensis]